MTSRRRIAVTLALALVVTPVLAGCSLAETIVGGAVNEARDQIGGAVGDAVAEALGGAGISTDGELPPGFPAAEIPIVGTVNGGGSAPDSTGWVVNTTLTGVEQFTEAQAALEGAGYTSAAVNSTADSAFGTFTLAPYAVALTVTTGSDAAVTATYIVTVTQ